MFTSRFTKSIAGTALAAATLGMAAIVGAGTANADDVDDTYLASLAQAGIPQQDETLIVASMTAYCPHHLPALRS